MVLSIEQLTTSIRQPEQLSFLKNFISNYFTKFEIVIYLKSQEELINSHLSYSTMLGLDSSYDSLVNAETNDYYEFLKPWWDSFGIENMNIRIVDRDFLDNEDIISDFFHLIGGEQYSLFSQPIILDETMSNQAMYFLQRFNKFVPHSETSETIDPDRIDLSESLEAFSEGKHGLLLSGDRIRDIRSRYHHSNEKLKAIFFPERAELFPIKIIKETVKESLTSESTLEIAAFLWKHQQSKIKSLQKQTKQLRRQLINKNQSNDTSIS